MSALKALPIPRLPKADLERFWGKVNKSAPGGCWEWTGGLSFGYGQFHLTTEGRARNLRAHRVSYSLTGKSMSPDRVIDHICRNRACVNPDHLREIEEAENILIGIGPTAINARKERCARGHEYGGENMRETDRGYRVCKECRRQYAREERTREKGLDAPHVNSGKYRAPWTKEDLMILNNPDMSTLEMAALLGRTFFSVENRLKKLRKHQASAVVEAIGGESRGE